MGGSFHTYRPSFDEIFDQLWGNFSNIPGPKSGRIKNLNVEIPISAEQASRGGSARICIPAQTRCPVCNGFGEIGFFRCLRCDSKGYISGEYPLPVEYLAGISDDYTIDVSLNRYGIHNFYLTLHFRVGGR